MPVVAAIVGLAQGLTVGTALVAFLILLKVVPTLTWRVGDAVNHRVFDFAIMAGAMLGTLLLFVHRGLHVVSWATAPVGLLMGLVVGMTAAALAEVLLVLPLLERRLALGKTVRWLIIALGFGKVVGALADWLVFH